MPPLLKQPFQRSSERPEEELDEFARLILSELESEQRWSKLFARPESEDLLGRLADEALLAHRAGRTTPLDPEEL